MNTQIYPFIKQLLTVFLIFLIPWEIFAITIGGLTLRVYQLIAIVLILLALPMVTRIVGKLWNIDNLYTYIHTVLLGILWIILSISTIVAGSPWSQILVKIIVLGVFVGMMTIVALFIQSQTIDSVYSILIISTGRERVIGLYESIAFQLGWPNFQVFPGRVDSLLPEPNWFGMWITVMYGVLLPLTFREQRFGVRIALWSAILGSILINILTVTRASWLATGVMTVVFCVYLIIVHYREWGRVLRFIALILVILFGALGMSLLGLTDFNLKDRVLSIINRNTVFYSVIDPVTKEKVSVDQNDITEQKLRKDQLVIEEQTDTNVLSRIDGYKEALLLVQDNPILGIGLNGYENTIGQGRNPNNIFLSIAVSGGILSLACFITFLYLVFKQSILLYPSMNYHSEIIVLTMMAILITGQFNDNFLLGFVWLIFGLWQGIILKGFSQEISEENNSKVSRRN